MPVRSRLRRVVGDGVGGAGADVVRLSAADQIATTAVTVSASGLLDLNNFNETIGSLSGVAGAQVSLGAATLTGFPPLVTSAKTFY